LVKNKEKSIADILQVVNFSYDYWLSKKWKAKYLGNELAFNEMYKLADKFHIDIVNELDVMNKEFKENPK
jgi:hypothetical protein